MEAEIGHKGSTHKNEIIQGVFDFNNLLQQLNFLIFMEILENYDAKTNQLVLTPKQLNLVSDVTDLILTKLKR